MSLILTPASASPEAAVALKLRELASSLQGSLLNHHQAMFNAFWFTPGVDPQDVLDELGEDGESLFTAGSAVIDLILQQNPSALTLEQYTPVRAPTFEGDGTVTLEPSNPDG